MNLFKQGISFHSFTPEYLTCKWSFEDMMELAAHLGGGVEIVGPAHQRGFPYLSSEFLRQFKSAVERFELTPTCYGSYADPFMLADRDLSDEEMIEYTALQLRAAAALGFPIVRLQYFVRGIIERLLPLAEKLNLRLGYELHAPLTFEADETRRLIDQIERVNHPSLGLIPDCGIFARSIPKFRLALARQQGVEDRWVDRAALLWQTQVKLHEAQHLLISEGLPEAQFVMLEPFWGTLGQSDPRHLVTHMKHIVHMHGKYYSIDDGDEPDVRYGEIVAALIDGGYQGWMSTEYEGSANVNSFLIAQAHQQMVARHAANHDGRSRRES